MKSTWLYRLASFNNDLRAVSTGKPEVVAARIVRKSTWRHATRLLKRALR
jgi:hypothetical protein